MARLTHRAFRFSGRDSGARHWDIRYRVAAVGILGVGVLSAPELSLVPLAATVGVLLAWGRVSVREAFGVVAGWAPFLVFFWGLGWALEPTGAQAVFLGVQAGRLVLLWLLGHFLFVTATPRDVADGIRWYLGWLGHRAWLAANMASWAWASVPLILDQTDSLLEAASLRGLTLSRHPIKTLRMVFVALLVRTVTRSTELTEALEARGLGAAVPAPKRSSRPQDGAALLAVAAIVAASWVLVPGGILNP